MTEKKNKYRLLMSLLAPLLREWGYDTVQQCVAEVHAEQAKENLLPESHKPKPTKDYRRPNAVEMIERLDVSVDRKEPLRQLAARFDAKTFLPTASDVRHFLEMRGQDPGPVKQRQDAFRKVIYTLQGMADDELILLITSGTHAGPTQLGPLSDAIKATSIAVRSVESQKKPTTAEEPVEPPSTPAGGDAGKS